MLKGKDNLKSCGKDTKTMIKWSFKRTIQVEITDTKMALSIMIVTLSAWLCVMHSFLCVANFNYNFMNINNCRFGMFSVASNGRVILRNKKDYENLKNGKDI